MDNLLRHRGRIIVACALAVIIAAGPVRAVSVHLDPPTQTLLAGQTCTVDLWVMDLVSPGMEALELSLTYDASLLDATGVGAGPLLTGLGEPLFEDLDFATDGFIYAVATLGSQSSTGSGIAVSITFEADSANTGISLLDYTAILLEPTEPYGTGGEIAHTQSTGDWVSVIPEPATLLLLAAGLMGLLGHGRKRRA